MINNNTQEKINNSLLSLLVVLGIFAIGAYFFDFYYDLNDDMVIKDILAGAYSGTPDGHTNQMLYPIGFLISGLYRLMPQVPVFGIFLPFSPPKTPAPSGINGRRVACGKRRRRTKRLA